MSTPVEIQNRRRMLLELIKSSKSTTLKDLGDSLGVKAALIAKDIAVMQKTNPDIVRPKGSTKVYWTAVKSDDSVEFDRYPFPKNSEGYHDPTAESAMASVKTEEILFKDGHVVAANDIWEARENSGSYDEYIILSVDRENGFASCVRNLDDPVSWHKIYSKPFKYFVRPISIISKGLRGKIDAELMSYFGFAPAETVKVDEKSVEEVHVDTASDPSPEEDLYTRDDLYVALLRQKADIYESIVKGGYLCAR